MRWRIGLHSLWPWTRNERSGLTPEQEDLLRALVGGYHLKSHRYLDGTKVNRLHDADGLSVRVVSTRDVERLDALGYIAANMKFPAAVYLLTESGDRLARTLSASSDAPVTVRLPVDGREDD